VSCPRPNAASSTGRAAALASRAAAEPVGPVPLPEAAALARSDRRELAAALAGLGADHREVIVLRYLLDLSEAEVEQLTAELGAILDAVSKVSELDLADVPPTSHPLDLVNEWAEDEPRPSLPREDALANAPDPFEGAFRVPAVGG